MVDEKNKMMGETKLVVVDSTRDLDGEKVFDDNEKVLVLVLVLVLQEFKHPKNWKLIFPEYFDKGSMYIIFLLVFLFKPVT